MNQLCTMPLPADETMRAVALRVDAEASRHSPLSAPPALSAPPLYRLPEHPPIPGDAFFNVAEIVTDTGLNLPVNLSYERWEALAAWLGANNSKLRWAIGDAILYGRAAYGERYTQAIDLFGIAYDTANSYRYVAARFEKSRRRAGIPWWVYREIAPMKVDEVQSEWLDFWEQQYVKPTQVEFRHRLRHDNPVPIKPLQYPAAGIQPLPESPLTAPEPPRPFSVPASSNFSAVALPDDGDVIHFDNATMLRCGANVIVPFSRRDRAVALVQYYGANLRESEGYGQASDFDRAMIKAILSVAAAFENQEQTDAA